VNVSARPLLVAVISAVLWVVEPVSAAQIAPGGATDRGPSSRAASGAGRSALDPRILEADDLYSDHQVTESLQLLEDVIDEHPEMYEALWAATRSAVARGLLSRGRDAQNQWYRIGESYARRASEVEPEGLDGLYWLLTAKGLRAAQSGGQDAAALSREVYDLAHQVLEADSLHPGAHHALGVLNYRVRRLSTVERFMASNFMGGDVVGLTSWEDAERYLLRAGELRPDYILYHLDLGRMFLHRDRKEDARRHLERALELPEVEPPDGRFQQIAARRLEEALN
jgi:tetratricopeptide (TPR) repeat protein